MHYSLILYDIVNQATRLNSILMWPEATQRIGQQCLSSDNFNKVYSNFNCYYSYGNSEYNEIEIIIFNL